MSDERQHRFLLDRKRVPRVRLTYEVEIAGAIEKRELPFVVGVMADLSGQPKRPLPRVRDRRFVSLERDTLSDVMRKIQPSLQFAVENTLAYDDSKLKVDLQFKSMEDFDPVNVAKQVSPLRLLLELRDKLSDLRSALQANDRLETILLDTVHDESKLKRLRGELDSFEQDQALSAKPLSEVFNSSREKTLLETIVEQGRLGLTLEDQLRGKELVSTFLQQVLDGATIVSRDVETIINARIAAIDHTVSLQLDEVMHAPVFQKLESTWRGLSYLVNQTDPSPLLRIRVLNVSKQELLRDLQRAAEFDQSSLFRLVYEEEFGSLGGQPYGVLIGDYEISRHPQDLEMLERISNVAAVSNAPFVAAASPYMFGWESFLELGGPRDLSKVFDNSAYTRWKSFRESDDSRYIGLVLPHILVRLPYGAETSPVEAFQYEEQVEGEDHSRYLWGNAAYAFAARLTDAFALYGWCAAITGVERGGRIEGLPTHTFYTDDGEVALKCPTEVAITDRRENELAQLGFIPLCHMKGTGTAVFFAARSCHKPRRYMNDDANANAGLASQMEYILSTSRFAHYLKTIMRDKLGSFMSREECERYLNAWISQYVLKEDPASSTVEARSQFPLREARVAVRETPGKPGRYTAVAHMRPHFQLDELTVPLAVVVSLPQTGG
jgi:type VI secretion system protein ImpC